MRRPSLSPNSSLPLLHQLHSATRLQSQGICFKTSWVSLAVSHLVLCLWSPHPGKPRQAFGDHRGDFILFLWEAEGGRTSPCNPGRPRIHNPPPTSPPHCWAARWAWLCLYTEGFLFLLSAWGQCQRTMMEGPTKERGLLRSPGHRGSGVTVSLGDRELRFHNLLSLPCVALLGFSVSVRTASSPRPQELSLLWPVSPCLLFCIYLWPGLAGAGWGKGSEASLLPGIAPQGSHRTVYSGTYYVYASNPSSATAAP